MHNASEMEFGLHGEGIEGAVLWGARAIIRFDVERLWTTSKYHYVIECLWDRQSFAGTLEEKEAFKKKLNGTKSKPGALKKFIKAAYDNKLPVMEHTLHVVEFNGVEFSYRMESCESGYVYITARPVKETP